MNRWAFPIASFLAVALVEILPKVVGRADWHVSLHIGALAVIYISFNVQLGRIPGNDRSWLKFDIPVFFLALALGSIEHALVACSVFVGGGYTAWLDSWLSCKTDPVDLPLLILGLEIMHRWYAHDLRLSLSLSLSLSP